MVWAVVSLHHETNIVFINGNLTAARYQHEVLDTELISLLRYHRRMQLLHDGAPSHPARATTAYLNINNVNVDFLSKSPDFNIFENIWDELNCPVRRTGAIPTTLNQLRANILYVWNDLPQNYVQRYVTSTGHRCLAVVNGAVVHTSCQVHMDMDAAAGLDIRKL